MKITIYETDNFGTLNTEMFAKSGVSKDVSKALNPQEVARTIEFILKLNSASFPEIDIKAAPTSQ